MRFILRALSVLTLATQALAGDLGRKISDEKVAEYKQVMATELSRAATYSPETGPYCGPRTPDVRRFIPKVQAATSVYIREQYLYRSEYYSATQDVLTFTGKNPDGSEFDLQIYTHADKNSVRSVNYTEWTRQSVNHGSLAQPNVYQDWVQAKNILCTPSVRF